MLSIRNFSKKYSDRLILEIPTFDFASGAHWVRGENGSGKSTLFKAIAGMIPFEGEIFFSNGISFKRNPKGYLQRVTYSEAEPLFPGFISARDLFSFVGKARRASLTERKYYLSAFDIDEYELENCATYSSGMSKKVSIALAFLGRPDVIVLDEPLITLDAVAQSVLTELIRESIEKGTTFLVSSHQQIDRRNIRLSGIYTLSNKQLLRQDMETSTSISI
jgi:ABC-2 type transport system ATP-binding protein